MAITFDVVDDFNHTGIQPAAGYPFTYGTETTLNVGFTPFSYFANTSTSGVTGEPGTVDSWYFGESRELAGPCVGVVVTGGPLTNGSWVLPNDVLMMAPGSPEYNAPDLTVTRFTAPSTGLFDLAGFFSDLEAATVDLAIVINGVTVWSSFFNGTENSRTFSINDISLAQGARIDFVVDSLLGSGAPGSGGIGQQYFDVVGLKALITETNAAPSLTLTNTTTSLAEGSYANHLKVADITVTDDGVGNNDLTLSGDDAALFEVFDGDLYLKAGTVLDFEGGNTTLDVTVAVDDPVVGSNPDDSETLTIAVEDVPGETINGTSRADTLTGTFEADIINGLAGNDNLQGLGGDDTLDGGSGKDTMAGGTGNDIYVVDSSTDVVTENANEGVDTVQSSVSYTLVANVEKLTLIGTQKINGTGNTADNVITGNGANNTLSGLVGNDTLDGGAGNDVLNGGAGADNITGGTGADKFSFSAVTDSTSANPDQIQDFVHGTDIIDLSAIDANLSKNGNQAFGFAGLNNQAVANSVTWFENSEITIVQADVNGDATADFVVVLVGINHNLSASDFVL